MRIKASSDEEGGVAKNVANVSRKRKIKPLPENGSGEEIRVILLVADYAADIVSVATTITGCSYSGFIEIG